MRKCNVCTHEISKSARICPFCGFLVAPATSLVKQASPKVPSTPLPQEQLLQAPQQEQLLQAPQQVQELPLSQPQQQQPQAQQQLQPQLQQPQQPQQPQPSQLHSQQQQLSQSQPQPQHQPLQQQQMSLQQQQLSQPQPQPQQVQQQQPLQQAAAPGVPPVTQGHSAQTFSQMSPQPQAQLSPEATWGGGQAPPTIQQFQQQQDQQQHIQQHLPQYQLHPQQHMQVYQHMPLYQHLPRQSHNTGNVLNVVSLVLGLIAIISSCMPLLGLSFAIGGIICGLVGRAKTPKEMSSSLAIVGIVFSALGIALALIIFALSNLVFPYDPFLHENFIF